MPLIQIFPNVIISLHYVITILSIALALHLFSSSFECHPCVLMEDLLMTELEQEFDEEELGRLDDIFVELITSLHKRQ